MNSDRCVRCFVLGLLPILWLPREGLVIACVMSLSVALYALMRRSFLGVILGVLLGFSYLQIEQVAKNAENLIVRKGSYTVEITRLLKQLDYQTAIGKLKTGEQVYLNWQSQIPLKLGQTYQIELNPRALFARQNIGNFDRQKWYFANHVTAISSVKKAALLPHSQSSWRMQWLEHVKQQTTDLPTQGLLLALAFGERAWLPNAHWLLFQQTTTAHLIAISGLHIVLAFTIGFWVAKQLLGVGLRLKWLPAVEFPLFFAKCIGLLFALGYSYLAGFAIPTQRALMAIIFLFVLQHLRRHHTPWQLWWRVVAFLLLLDPIALLSDSFWLSILAVASLILWYQYFPLKKFYIFSHKIARSLVAMCHLQLGILLIFTPAQFFFFEGSSPWAFIANLIIVPLYSFLLVPLILFTLLTNNLLGSWQLTDWLAQQSLALLTPLSHHWITLSQFWQWQVISLSLLILLVIYYWLYRRPKLFYLLTGVAVFNALFYLAGLFRPTAQWLMFDVGQGLAMAFVQGNQAIMFDTGASWKSQNVSANLSSQDVDNSMAKLEILPYLARHGLQVKAIFLSHDDNDHSGGVASILRQYPDAELISAGQRSYNGKVPTRCEAGKKWQFGDFYFSAFHPKHAQMRAKNEDSCTLLVEIGKYKILLTGDLHAQQESFIANQIGQIDFLQVGHHGSKTSTSESLLRLTQPKVAFISLGRFNPWKMPNEQVIKRLEKHKILQINTGQAGMIEVNFYPDHWYINTARTQWSAWYDKIYP